MAIRDLDRLAQYVKAHRLELYASRRAAAQAAGISKDTWQRVEEGQEVREVTYVKVDDALGWATGSCVAVAEGREPALAGARAAAREADEGLGAAAAFDEEVARKAAFEAARATMPTTSIGAIDAFVEEFVEVMRRSFRVSSGA
jgi:hypothetical protein